MPGCQGRRRLRQNGASEGAGGDGTACDGRGDGRRAPAPPQAARPVRRSRPCCGDQAHAAALRLSQDQRGLQSPLHVLHHSVDARRPRVAPDRRGAGRGAAAAAIGREGAARDFAGHERVRRRRQVPHGVLAGPAAEDADDRARDGARRDGPRAWRVGSAPLRLSVSARRRGHRADDRRSGGRRAPSLSRRAVPAREPADPQADEAARQRRGHAAPHRSLARRASRPRHPQHVHRRLPRRDRARVRRAARVSRRRAARPRRLLRLLAGGRCGGQCAARSGARRREGRPPHALHGNAGENQHRPARTEGRSRR